MCFIVELILKVMGLGFKGYLADGYNKIDCILVLLSLIEMTLELYGKVQLTSGAFTVLRGFRLLRILKLARSWNALRDLLSWAGKTLK